MRIIDEGGGSIIDTEETDLAVIRQKFARAEIGRQIEVLEDLMPTLYPKRPAHVEMAIALAHLRAAYESLEDA